jgi:hypothetical protein
VLLGFLPIRIAWLVVWMAAHDMWFNYNAKTCTITAKYLDEEEFAWEPQEFRMPGVEKAEDAEESCVGESRLVLPVSSFQVEVVSCKEALWI